MSDLVATMHGLPEVLGKMQGVSTDLKQKGGRYALRRAANVVRNAARKNARALDDPRTPESIARNIVVRSDGQAFRRTGDIMFRVGVLGGAKSPSKNAEGKRRRRSASGGTTLEDLGEIAGAGGGNPGGDTFYWRFLEFGTQKMAARPFMRPALTENIQRATDEFVAQYEKGLERALRRAPRARGV